jgi:NAD(P)-dependent dehydrogenase (short-subunit alcohol dehydrogenase family)
MHTGLKNRIAVITGAANGIGRATALAFAREGSHLGLLDINAVELESRAAEARGLGATVHTAQTDLSTAEGVLRGMQAVQSSFENRLDILVNNVGSGAIRSFDDVADPDWEATLRWAHELRSCIRCALPILRDRGGVIINNWSDLPGNRSPYHRLFCVEGGYSVADEALARRRSTHPRMPLRLVRSDAVLDQARRLCGNDGQVPQDGAAGGG